MILTIYIYALIAFLCCRSHIEATNFRIYKLWAWIFCAYCLFTLLSHTYINNPLVDYFISPDQTYFYEEAIKLCHQSFADIIIDSFTSIEYITLPLPIAWFASLARVGNMLNVDDILLFEKFNVAFISSLIPVYIYKSILLRIEDGSAIFKQILIFALISPIFVLACQMMRDIHICFMYTIMAYIILKQNVKFKWLYLSICIILILLTRLENGLFALAFILVPVYRFYKKSGPYMRTFIIVTLLFCFIASLGIIFAKMSHTLMGYYKSGVNTASADSLGVLLNKLPFPLDYISKASFSQLLPFPCWTPFLPNDSYVALRVVECFFPFYWTAILWSIFYNIKDILKKTDISILYILGVSFLYIILCASGELNTRRIMSVYPIIFICYFVIKQNLGLSYKSAIKFTLPVMIILHFVYFIIK